MRLVFIGSALYTFLPSFLPLFDRMHPGIRFEMTEMANSAAVRSLEEGQADLGIVRLPISCNTYVGIVPLEKYEFSAVCHRSNPLARQKSVSLQDLSEEPFIQYTGESPGMDTLVAEMFQKRHLTLRIAQHARQIQTILGLVESGMGVALVSVALCPLYSRV